MARLVCDARERAVWAALNEFEELPEIQLSKAQLDVGDFAISVIVPGARAQPAEDNGASVADDEIQPPTSDNGNVTKRLIVERKAWDDHCASILDGRRKEQTARALAMREQEAPHTTFVLLIEGVFPSWDGSTRAMKNKNAHAALLKSAIRDCIPVLYSRDVQTTASMLLYLAKTFAAGGLDPAIKATERAASGYAGAARFAKRKANTQEAQWSCMLATIPGISGAKANLIAETFPNAKSLVSFIATESCKALSNTPCGGGKRLGPALAAKLCKVFG
jgi:ERCC4-type nuclease